MYRGRAILMVRKETMRILARCLKLFNSIGVISVLVMLAMVLTMLTGSAAGESNPQLQQQSLIQSHLYRPAAQIDTAAHTLRNGFSLH